MNNNLSPRLLRLKQVQAIIPLHRVTIYRKVLEGSFPAPLSLGARAVAWREDEVLAWLNSRPVNQ